MFAITILCLILLVFYFYCVVPHSYWKKRGVLQAKTKWIFGENWQVVTRQESFAETIKRIYKKFPNVRYFGTYMFNSPVLVVKDLELIKQILIKDFEHFVDHRLWVPETTDPLWSNNLFALKGEKWKETRTFLTPAFTGTKVRTMFVLLKAATENFMEYLNGQNRDFIELDLRDTFNRYTCDTIATSAFGIEVDSLKNRDNEFYKHSSDAGTFTGLKSLLVFVTLFLPDSIVKLFDIKVFNDKVKHFFTKLVGETVKIREEKGIVRPDMIHLMMEAKKGKDDYYNIEEENESGFSTFKTTYLGSKYKNTKMEISNTYITSQALIFILGGSQTVSTLLRFTGYELGVNSEVQEKLRKEIFETLENTGNNVTYEILQNMKYMDMVVTEVLRKWTGGFLLDRVCTKPYRIPATRPDEIDITIESGTLLWIPVLGLHYDPQYYTNPEKFDPERFNDENKNNINPFTYLPFGRGPRNCIAYRFALMEVKILYFHLLQEYEITPVEKSSIPIKFDRRNFQLDGDSFIFGLKKLKENE